MRMVATAACAIGVAVSGAFAPTGAASAASTICVGARPGCYATIQPALDAAHDGDTIAITRGTYSGGLTIDVSVAIVGAGASSTIIKGGGPVLTIGAFGAPTGPTVSIAGVQVTGGVTSSAPTPDGPITSAAAGGGIYIAFGATVTIRNSVITGNRATPSSTSDSGEPCPGGGDCPNAAGLGGGIAEVGRLTLISTTVSNNVAGGALASAADGGGIWTATGGGPGALTLIDSSVTGNSASVAAPNGRFASGGGIDVQDGEAFTVTNSVVSNNVASVTSSYPSGVEMNADSGGIHIGGFGSASIQGARITGNVVSAHDAAGQPSAGDSALSEGRSDSCVCGQTFAMTGSVVSGNRTLVYAAATGDTGPSSGAVELDGSATITNTAITANTTDIVGLTGPVQAFGAIFAIDGESQPVMIRNSLVAGNVMKATTPSGAATVEGAGIVNAGWMELHDVVLTGNVGTATGPSGSAEGGGIWNGEPFGPDGAPTPTLLVDHSTVLGNALHASPGLTVQGGGLFTSGFAVSLTSSLIAHNLPDQCMGC